MLARLEAHGTGTALGDPIEAGSLAGAVLAGRGAGCVALAAGSFKANSGHAEPAAGLAGLLVLMRGLLRQQAVPNAQLRVLNPHVGSAVGGGACALPTGLAGLSAPTGIAGGVSSFGYSGTIAHVVLQSYVSQPAHGVCCDPLTFRRRAFPWLEARRVVLQLRVTARRRLRDSHRAEQALDAVVKPAAVLPSWSAVLVVGAGIAGLTVAGTFAQASIPAIVLEKSLAIGGVWRHHANPFSRVNSSEPSYRLSLGLKKPNTNHTPTSEVLVDILRLVELRGLANSIFVQAAVERIVPDGARWRVQGRRRNAPFGVSAAMVAVCTNRRLGVPRQLSFSGEERFEGTVRRGLAGDAEARLWRGRRVLIVGMGAFGIENMRTALEGGAAHVTVLCRRRGAVCPQIVDWVNFIRPWNEQLRHAAAGDTTVLQMWQRAYDTSSAVRPECWEEGLLKPDGHTVSVSDLFFVAHHMRMMATRLGEVVRLEEHVVCTSDGARLEAGVVIKAVGFETNCGNSELLGRTHMRSNGLVARGLWLLAEPHLDSGVFTSPFGSSYLSGVRFSASQLLRYWHDPVLAEGLLHAGLSLVPIDTFTASESLSGVHRLNETDPDGASLLRSHLASTAADCHSMMTPEQYLAGNEAQWAQLHDILRPSAPVGWGWPLPYPFESGFCVVLQAETPQLLSGRLRTTSKNDGIPAIASEASSRLLSLSPAARQRAVKALVVKVVGDVVSGAVDADVVLLEQGLDSLGAAALFFQLQEHAGVQLVSSLLIDHPTVRQLTIQVLGELEGAPPAARPVARHDAHILPRRQLVLPDEPRLLLMREGAEGEPLLVMLPSNFGTVLDRLRLARALPAEVWGVEHGLLSTGDEEAYLRHTTLEEQAAEYAHMLIAAMAAKGRRLLHLFGGSFDGLCAQKAHPHPPSPAAHPLCTPRARPPLSHPCLGTQVGVALRERSSPPGVVFLVDPPPPGPCSIEAVELCNDRAVGAWAVRAGHIAEGLAADEVDMAQIAALFAPCNSLSECAYVATAELVKLPGQSLLAAQVCPLLRRRALLPGRGCTVCPQSAPWSPQSTLVSAGAVRRRALHGAAHPDLPQAHGWRHAT